MNFLLGLFVSKIEINVKFTMFFILKEHQFHHLFSWNVVELVNFMKQNDIVINFILNNEDTDVLIILPQLIPMIFPNNSHST